MIIRAHWGWNTVCLWEEGRELLEMDGDGRYFKDRFQWVLKVLMRVKD